MKNLILNHEKYLFAVQKVLVKLKFVWLFSCSILLSVNLAAQQKGITITVEHATLIQIISELREQTDFYFIYNHEEVNDLNDISLSVHDATVEEVLDICLKASQHTYQKINNTIVIVPAKKQKDALQENTGMNLSQTVRGTILDADSKLPLIGTTVLVLGTNPILATVTDTDGNFRLEHVVVGRRTLHISYLGYESKTIPNVVVNSGKETVLNIDMSESLQEINEVVIRPNKNKGEALNDMTILSSRSISPEETKRFAGGWTDPSRLVSNFAGVTSTPDGSNDITVRGNSPKYIQWRMEGIEIAKPYHFDDQNGMGGDGMSILNNNLLGASDFATGAFAPEYGNALSGVYDVKLKTGNNEKFEASFGAGLLGIDLALEGPIKKGYGGSYLVNYRYSFSGIIGQLGLIEDEGLVTFQDATFKVVLPSKKAGTFSIFGIGGLDSYVLEDVSDMNTFPGSKSLSQEIRKDYDKHTYLSTLGMNHTLSVNSKSYLKTSLSYSTTGIKDDVYRGNRIFSNDEQAELIKDSVTNKIQTLDNDLLRSMYRGAVSYHFKLNAKHKFQIGTKVSLFDYDYRQNLVPDGTTEALDVFNFDEQVTNINNYISWKFRPIEKIEIVSGLHNMNVLLNSKSTLEPRLAISYKLNEKNSIHAGYGLHSTMESINHYFTQIEDELGNITQPNKDLGLLKAHHYVLGYERRFTENLRGKVEIYYQDLFDLPVENSDSSTFATINEGYEYRYVDLVNKGTGKNYGIEYTLERFFADNYYFLINGSFFNSTYKTLEGIERNTQFNSKYLLNILIGKEFVQLGKKNNQTLGINLKTFYGGGRRIIPLLRDAQGELAIDAASERYYDYSKAYDNKLDDIFQINLLVSYKFERANSTHEIFVDLMNLTNNRGRVYEYYDENEPSGVGYLKQYAFFPNMMYRVYF